MSLTLSRLFMVPPMYSFLDTLYNGYYLPQMNSSSEVHLFLSMFTMLTALSMLSNMLPLPLPGQLQSILPQCYPYRRLTRFLRSWIVQSKMMGYYFLRMSESRCGESLSSCSNYEFTWTYH